MGRVIRVGAVRYLNAKPLYRGLEHQVSNVRLDLDVPSRLADRLGSGELDLALIPSIEYFRGARDHGYEILRDFSISAHGAVRSVKLYTRVPFAQIRRLALDEGSRTSQALARVWLAAEHGVLPERIEPLPMGVPVEESTADAALVIGDRAMKPTTQRFHAVVDLGQAWNALTGLPFVFALWVTRRGVDLGTLPETLEACRRRGLADAECIAREEAPRLGLDVPDCVDYLTRVLSYELGRSELAGLTSFAERATALGLAPGGVDLVFHERRLDPAVSR